ncbi:uncharacterized protein LOC121986939 [Zingiber officinale]|uniref:uncharacterized protein LOC121986939 n=1 Tax=Zingiber officinale TaxID=94328 RepID=UPI001C4C6153|nr:uncharacterized protein LOC121986939 [Zingiber officinale]
MIDGGLGVGEELRGEVAGEKNEQRSAGGRCSNKAAETESRALYRHPGATSTGCIRQIEELNPWGALEEDIGFKFGHVWSILQGIEKFNSDNIKAASTRVQRQTAQADYSQSYNLEKDVYSPSSPHVSSFNLNITNSDSGDTSTKRPIGVNKTKLKRKNEQQFSKMVSQNDELVAALDRSANVAMFKEENKILFKDLNTIVDPIMREFIRGE